VKRVAVISSASGCGKTTVGRDLARRLDLPFHELDALHHGPNWTEATAEELRAKVAPLVAEETWVIDGSYRGKLGDLVLAAADTVVWLDLPMRVWLPRLTRRTYRRWRTHEELWNGNRENLRDSLLGRDALIPYALRSYRERRRRYPVELAAYPVVRLRSQREVNAWLDDLRPGGQGPDRGDHQHQHG
jgi:adenylate kinase family enzyme